MTAKQDATTIYLDPKQKEKIQEKAKRAQVSMSTYLSRAGSIVDFEDVVKFPLNNKLNSSSDEAV